VEKILQFAPEGLSANLLEIAFAVFISVFLIIRTDLGIPTSLFVSFLKVSIPFVYFAFYFDGSWTFEDDMLFFSEGETIADLQGNPLGLIFSKAGIDRLSSSAGGRHFLYIWWNAVLMAVWGKSYYVAVFVNVVLTSITGLLCMRLVRMAGFSSTYAKAFLVFFLLHPEILAWSSVANLKDLLVMALLSASLLNMVKLSQRFTIRNTVWLLLIFILIGWIRFYLIFLIIISFALYSSFLSMRQKIVLAFSMLFVLFPFFGDFGQIGFLYSIIDLNGYPLRIIRFLITPRPWSISPEYSFLLIPSIWNLAMLSLLPFAVHSLWKNRSARLTIITFAVIWFASSLLDFTNGVRHRIQLLQII